MKNINLKELSLEHIDKILYNKKEDLNTTLLTTYFYPIRTPLERFEKKTLIPPYTAGSSFAMCSPVINKIK